MSPSQALDEQRALLDYVAQPTYARYAEGMAATSAATGGVAVKDRRTGKVTGEAWQRNEVHALGMAETFWVAPDMVTLSEAAARSLDESDTFRHDLWPADVGFCWLARPWYLIDVRGQRLGVRAFSWYRMSHDGQAGTFLTEYGDADDMQCEVSVRARQEPRWPEVRRSLGRLHINGFTWIPDGMVAGPQEQQFTEEEAEQYARRHHKASGYVPLGRFWEDEDESYPVVTTARTNPQRLHLALVMLLGQHITRVERIDADRPVARRAKRAGLPPRVTVIRLREVVDDTREYVGETNVQWSHRWLVHGKWQWRRCGAQHPGAQPYEGGWRVRVFIRDYVKGPRDLPLVIKDRVYALER
jgi:hypothetical protein